MGFTKKVIQSLVAAGLALTLTTGFAFASIGTGTVTADSLRLRESASSSAATLAYASKGSKVTVLEDAGGGWYKVSYNNVEGYMSGEWLDIELGESEGDNIGTVNDGPLNVRSGPGTDYDKVGTLKRGDKVEILDDTVEGWYEISNDELTGYVSSEYITLGDIPQQGMITTSVLNVRSGAGTSFAKIGTLKAGTTVDILDDSISGWYEIAADDLTGYVSASYVVILGDSSTPSSVGAAAAAMAASLVGCRYVSGAAGPSSFDCSGLTYYIYKQLGYSIPHGSSSQYNQSGYFVSIDSMQPGDLVFFFDPKFDSSGGRLPTTHVGIYMGNNQFIHASTTSYRVQYDTLFGGYFGNYVVGAKRIG